MFHTPFTERPADYYDRIYADGYSTRSYRPVYDAVLETLRDLPNPRVLEIGCGTGELGLRITRSRIPYRGFDLSPVAVEHCHAAGLQSVVVGSAYDRALYLPRDYNVVIALEVFQHLDDLRVVHLLPRGLHVLFSVPDFVETAHLRAYQDPQHDIVEYYSGQLDVDRVRPFRFVAADGQLLTIYLAHARVGSKQGTERATAQKKPRPVPRS